MSHCCSACSSCHCSDWAWHNSSTSTSISLQPENKPTIL